MCCFDEVYCTGSDWEGYTSVFLLKREDCRMLSFSSPLALSLSLSLSFSRSLSLTWTLSFISITHTQTRDEHTWLFDGKNIAGCFFVIVTKQKEKRPPKRRLISRKGENLLIRVTNKTHRVKLSHEHIIQYEQSEFVFPTKKHTNTIRPWTVSPYYYFNEDPWHFLFSWLSLLTAGSYQCYTGQEERQQKITSPHKLCSCWVIQV